MKRAIISLLGVFSIVTSHAQLNVTSNQVAQQLAENLAGSNINVFNASLTGNSQQNGIFNFLGSGLDIGSGVILSSGNVNDAIGPNNDPGTTTGFGGSGTSETDALSGTFTMDAVTLQFDFEVQSESIEFNYIFASEEYLEFVNAGVNDAFGFFISGPGITGQENLAIIPTTTTPVTIDDINDNNHWQFFNDNTSGSTDLEYDGFTTTLTASKTGLQPCNVYTLKLIIADAGDDQYDSGVFLEENSLVQEVVSAISNTINNDSVALEGCTKASFTFNLDSAISEDVVISYQIGGTAVNGVDYKHLDTALVIVAGQTSATIILDAFADGIPESQETVTLQYRATPCSAVETVTLYIDDADPIDFTLGSVDVLCEGSSDGQIKAAVTGGFSPYQILLNGTDVYNFLPITGLPAGTYQVEVDDIYGCAGEAQVVGDLYDAGSTFLPDGNGNVFTTSIPISGLGGSLTDVNQIQSICLNMEHSYLGDIEMKLIAPNGAEIVLKERPGGNRTNLGEPVAKGPVDGANSDTTAGVGYDYCFTNTPTYGTMVSERNNYTYTYTDNTGRVLSDKYLPSGSYQSYEAFSALLGTPFTGNWAIWVKDHKPQDNGYIFNWSISFIVDRGNGDVVTIGSPNPIDITGGVTATACGGTDGEIDISVSGDFPNFDYQWSNSSTSQDLTGLTAGSYTVTVTDQNSCTKDSTFLVSNNSTLVLSANLTNPLCNGESNGSIDLTVSGGSGNYSYSWSNGAGNSQDPSGLSAGIYIVTVTDNTSTCVALKTFELTEAGTLAISGSVTDENCGDREGVVDISIQGGTRPYSYSWTGSSSTDSIATNLQQGTYVVTVTDDNSCSIQQSFDVINLVGNCIPNCDLSIDNEIVVNENCGQTNGSISLSVSSTSAPINIFWSNGGSTSNISGLNTNTYTVTLTDDATCSLTKDYTIVNNSGSLSISNASVSNEACGNGSGGVDITIVGGSFPYSFAWSNSSTNEDLTNVAAGTYSVIVTDNSGCSVNQSFSVTNQAGSLQQTFGYAMDEVCGNSGGSIDISITGGVPNYNYSWSNGSSNEDLINIGAGTYSCTITDQTGCSLTTPTYIVNNDAGLLAIDFIDVDDEVCNNSLGAISLNVIGGSGSYGYAWSNSATSSSISNLTVGVYSVVVSDGSGCDVNSGDIIVSDLAPNLSVDNAFIQHETCSDGSGAIDLEILGDALPFVFSWSNGPSTEDITSLSTGTYTCTVTDSNNCQIISTSTVLNNAGTLSVDNSVVAEDSCGLTVGAVDITTSGQTGNIYYSWSNGETTEDLTGLSAGTYTCTVTDDGGCSTSITEIVGGGGLSVDNISVSDEICDNNLGAIDVTISGGSGDYRYNWSNGQNNEDLEYLNEGTYTLMVEDNISGCQLFVEGIVNNSSSNMSVTGTIVDDNCGAMNGSVTITVAGGTPNYNFEWSNSSTAQNLSNLSGGTYMVEVSDQIGCSATETFVVDNASTGIEVTNITSTDEFCNDGTGSTDITVGGGSGNYMYSWDSGQNTNSITGLSAGTYVLTATDVNDGCSVVQSVDVLNNTGSFLYTAFVTNEICGTPGNIDLTINGGSGSYSFDWSNGATTEDISGLPPGTYTCEITDNNSGCILNTSLDVVDEAGNLSLMLNWIQDDFCSQGEGFISISVLGGADPVDILWSNGGVGTDLFFVDAGMYYVTVTDNNGCSMLDSFVIGNETFFDIVDTTIIDATCSVCDNGAIDIDVIDFGAPGIIQFNWSNGASTEDVFDLLPGEYDVEVSVDDGFFICTLIETYVVGNDSTSTGIEDIQNNWFRMYPNPNDGHFIIQHNLEINQNSKARIMDLFGREVEIINLNSDINTVDISSLSSGTYLVEIESDNGKLVEKVVVNK